MYNYFGNDLSNEEYEKREANRLNRLRILKERSEEKLLHQALEQESVNDVLWSTAVHMGPHTQVVSIALSYVQRPYGRTKAFDHDLIIEIYKERGRKKENGDLIYFSRNSRTVQLGVASRFVSEQERALERLENEDF